MTTFVLIAGGGGAGADHWTALAHALRRSGHTVVPVDFAPEVRAAGLAACAAVADAVIASHRDVVAVAAGADGFVVPMLVQRARIGRIVFVNAAIPLPHETLTQWGRSTGVDLAHLAGGDIEPDDAFFARPCIFDAWPIVPTTVLTAADDRIIPRRTQVRAARERLGIAAAVVPGGHLVAKTRPVEVARRLSIFSLRHEVAFDLAAAAGVLRRIALGVTDDQLGYPTPCAGWPVRRLLAHVCTAARSFAEAARHDVVDEFAPPGLEPPLGWRDELPRDLAVLITAWLDPAAWRGAAEATDVTMPSPEVARVALSELVVHAWDLAVATGQPYRVDTRDLEICLDYAVAMSAPEMLASRRDLYADAVPTSPDASALDRLLALTGRRTAQWPAPRASMPAAD